MLRHACWLVVLSCVCLGHSMKLPSYFKPCFRNDPNINECFKQHAIEAIPLLVTPTGDPEYGIPAMKPMRFKELKFNDKDLQFSFHDLVVVGLEGVEIQDMKIDMVKHHEEAYLFWPRLEISGMYMAKGNSMGMELDGHGPCNMTLKNMKVLIAHDYVLDIGKSGKDHMTLKNIKITLDPEDAFLRFDDMFKDKSLSEDVNGMLNENWRELLAELGPTLTKPLELIAMDVYNGVTEHVPYHDIYPESAEILAAEKD